MTPSTDENLNRFLVSYQRAGRFLLMPATYVPGQQPEVFESLVIGKTKLTVRDAADIQEGDLERMALGPTREDD